MNQNWHITMALLVGLSLCTTPATADHQSENVLSQHPSPYLRLHGHDPIHWLAWDAQALTRARQENKPLFVSVGYFSCHWCHVMQAESFSDKAIAKIVNEHFVAIKVDRELMPALDAHLIEFVQATRGFAGWPLNVFVTPEGYPLVGATYLPRETFGELLTNVHARWSEEHDTLSAVAQQAAQVLYTDQSTPKGPSLTQKDGLVYRQKFLTQIRTAADSQWGGFGRGAKFPAAPQLALLLAVQAHSPSDELRTFLKLTLSNMATQGLRDHLAGGFFRYTTRPDWQVPHFEKLLYTNALLATVYYDAAKTLHEPFYADVASNTIDFMLGELWQASGGFIAGLSAVDADGNEGGYYLFDRTTLEKTLAPDELKVVDFVFGLDRPSELAFGQLPVEAHTLEHAAKELALDLQTLKSLKKSATNKLLRLRDSRSLPRDDQVLVAWNGLALSALSRGITATGKTRYRQAATRLAQLLAEDMWDGDGLLRATNTNASFGHASLADYAFVARGLVDWAKVSDDDAARAKAKATAKAMVETAWRRFYKTSGWQLGEALLIPYTRTDTVLPDGSLPSPSATLLDVTLELEKTHPKAKRTIRHRSHAIDETPYSYPTHIGVLVRHLNDTP